MPITATNTAQSENQQSDNNNENIQSVREGRPEGRGQTGLVLACILFSMDLGFYQETDDAWWYWSGNQCRVRLDTSKEYHESVFANRRDCFRVEG